MERRSLNISQYLWWTERDSVLIAYYNADTDEFSSVTEVKPINLLYIQRPDKFLVPGEGPERDGFVKFDDSESSAYNKDAEYLGVYLKGGTSNAPTMADTEYQEQETEIPEQFHEALVNRVIANGYERKVETIPLSQHYMAKYEVGVKKAKAYAFRGRDGSRLAMKPMDF
tara:strand:- start:660 stop:1169 length:510 start_codon:yes stop_codon:yes gene_type:complete